MSLGPGQVKNWFLHEMSSMSRNLLSHDKPSFHIEFNAILIGWRSLILSYISTCCYYR